MAILRFSRLWISAILNFRSLIMGSLKSPCGTSWSSIEIRTLNCLLFEKIAFIVGDRQTHKQTNRWTEPTRKDALAVASGALIMTASFSGTVYIVKQPLRCRQPNDVISLTTAPFAWQRDQRKVRHHHHPCGFISTDS